MATINDMFGLGLKKDEPVSVPSSATAPEPAPASEHVAAPAPEAAPASEPAGEPKAGEEPDNK